MICNLKKRFLHGASETITIYKSHHCKYIKRLKDQLSPKSAEQTLKFRSFFISLLHKLLQGIHSHRGAPFYYILLYLSRRIHRKLKTIPNLVRNVTTCVDHYFH